MNKVAIVAGSEGFIGKHLSNALLKLGWKVFGIDIADNNNSEIDFLKKDISFLEPLDEIPTASVIFNCACYAEVFKYALNPKQILDSCYLGTRNLLNIAEKQGIKLIHLSTIDIERAYMPNDIKAPYIAGKLAAEALCLSSKNATVVRLNNVYGQTSDTDSRVVPTLIRKIEQGEIAVTTAEERAFCYVEDVAGLLIDMVKDESNIRLIRIDGERLSIKEAAAKIEKVVVAKTDFEKGLKSYV